MAELTITGGRVYTPDGVRDADVFVADGTIRTLEPWESVAPRGQVVNARGLLVMPGAVDLHVHSRDPGFPEREDFDRLTAAAAAGGTTTVVDMPNTVPGVDRLDAFEDKVATVSGRSRIDFALWGLIRGGSSAEDLDAVAEAGAVGFKAFLGYAWRRGKRQVTQVFGGQDPDLEAPPDYGTLARLAPEVLRWSLPVSVHCEDVSILAASARQLREYADLLAARPAVAEAVAIAGVGAIALETGLKVHVVHVSSKAGLRVGREAIAAGAPLTLETCPQYLWLTEGDYDRVGTPMKVYPPIRTAEDQAALRDALFNGEIELVATDHAPFTDAEKGAGLNDSPAGSPGVQSLLVSVLQLARQRGDLGDAVRWVSERPARLLGLYPRKGAIQPGADADLALVDPHGTTEVKAELMHSRQRHAALEGMSFDFAVRSVYSRGELVAKEGSPVGAPGRGRLLKPAGR